MAQGGIRVKLDLSDFVMDVGARRWMLITPGKMVTVGDLLEKLRGEYGQVGEEDNLTVFLEEQFLVPPWEPLNILKEGDLLRVTLSRGGSNLDEPPNAKRRRMEAGAGEKAKANREKPQSKDASSKGPVKKGKSIENPKKVPSGESSSSSDSSSEEEARAPIKSLNKTSDNKKQGVPKKLTDAQQSSSSDSSDSSDEEEDGEKAYVAAEKSKLLPPTNVLPKVQVATQQSKVTSSSSEDSSSDEDESPKNKLSTAKVAESTRSISGKRAEPTPACKSSSSSSSSEEEEEENTTKSNPIKGQPAVNGLNNGTGDVQNKKKRKRKRKPKNKNKLSLDQVPDFGPPIQPDPAFAKKAEVEKKNGHQRFEEEVENMEVEEEEAENISVEAMQALYNKSVSVPPVATMPAGSPSLNQVKPLHTPKGITANGSVSCEEALLASQDQRVVSNGNVASKVKAPPRVVFRPRALDVAQLRQPIQAERGSASSRFQLSTSTTAPTGMEALLNCQGQVFSKDGSEASAVNSAVKERDYSSFPPLSAVPGVGAVVAYKVMELSADYTPGVSAYKEGKVLAVEGQKLSIELVAGIIRRSGRFELGEEEVVEKNVEHNMRDLIEPVLVKQA